MIRRQIYYTEQQIKKLKAEANKTGIKVSELVRRIIDEYFDNKEKNK